MPILKFTYYYDNCHFKVAIRPNIVKRAIETIDGKHDFLLLITNLS